MNNTITPTQILEKYSEIGEKKAKSSTRKICLLGILSGVLIAFGSVATNTAVYGMKDPWTIKLICGLLFPFGLGMVILLGAELFTGNCLITISVLDKKCTVFSMLRNWCIVYIGNFIGSLIVAMGCAWFGQMNYSNGQLAVYTMKLAQSKCNISFANGIVLGFFCNILVCVAVLMALSASDTTGRIIGAYLPICFFVLAGFEHCVANMYYISAGLFAKMVPQYAEAARAAGISLSDLTVWKFIFGNLFPVTIGNILGGVGISYLLWLCHCKREEK